MSIGSIQSMSRRKEKQASRFLNSPPEALGRIIEIVNLIPPDYDLPDLSEEVRAQFWEAIKRDDLESAKQIFNGEIQRCLKDAPAAFIDWLNIVVRHKVIDVDYEWKDYSPFERYRKVKQWRENLRIIAEGGKRFYDFKKSSPEYFNSDRPESLKGSIDDVFTYLPLPAPSNHLITLSGKLQNWSDGFTEAIKDIDAWRVRECARCKRIFWAGRSDMWSCSTACAHALRSKRWRDNYQTKYKLQRNGQLPLSSEELKRLEGNQTLDVRRTTTSGAKKGK